MYGTVARLQARQGAEATFREFEREIKEQSIPGFRFQHVFRSDANPDELFLVVGFETKEAYLANASSPAQAARYEQYRAMLTAEPEWHDGEIVFTWPA